MKINNIQFYSADKERFCLSGKKPSFTSAPDLFKSSTALSHAINYAKSLKNFDNLPYERLEGIQDGIDVFKGLSARQVLKTMADLDSIPLVRGCSNQCTHCFLDAKPPIVRGSFEDFKSFIDGAALVNRRLGVNFKTKILNTKDYIKLLYNSDGAELYIRDKNGCIHEFPELNEMQYSITGRKGLFDTAGWNIKDKKTQERMERLVEYYSDKSNYEKMHGINISINPFHSLYAKSLENAKKGNAYYAEKLRDIYTERMANALFTFSPLFKAHHARVITRSFSDNQHGEMFKGVRTADFRSLADEIFTKYVKKLEDDYRGEQKYIKTTQDLVMAKGTVNYDLQFCDTKLALMGRLSKIFGFKSINPSRQFLKMFNDNDLRMYANGNTSSFIDINGKVYRVGLTNVFETDTALNYKNMGKFDISITPVPFDKKVNYK